MGDYRYDSSYEIDYITIQRRFELPSSNDKVAAAFAGNFNLHEEEPQIDSLAATYEAVRVWFEERSKQ
jgi:hypothetical protein